MSTSQEHLISSLKKIKEVEESVQNEIANYRKEIDNKISQLDAELEKAIAAAKIEGENLVDSSIEQSRKKASAETEIFSALVLSSAFIAVASISAFSTTFSLRLGSTPGSPLQIGQIFVLGGTRHESVLHAQKIFDSVFS